MYLICKYSFKMKLIAVGGSDHCNYTTTTTIIL